MESRLETAGVEYKKLNEEYEQVSHLVQRYQVWSAGQDAFYRYVAENPEFQDLWSYVIDQKLHLTDPYNIAQHFTIFKMELQRKVKELSVQKEVEELKKKLEWANKVAEDDVAKLKEQINTLEETLNRLYDERKESLDTLRSYKGKMMLASFVKETAQEAQTLQEKLKVWITKDYEHMERSSISEFIRFLDSEIRNREEKLRQVASKVSEVIRLETMVKASEEKAKALKMALAALSPKEGLIAKGLTGFINHFTELMNTIIARIMTYEMKIVPIQPTDEDFELDFYLPISVAGEIVDDIGETSKGQAEIINLAWRILYLKYKGLDGGILPLDEFGSNLDFKHRQRAFEAVRQILTITNFSQVLMVSHLSSTYDLMDGAGITLLCPSNVEIPAGVGCNETTNIERV